MSRIIATSPLFALLGLPLVIASGCSAFYTVGDQGGLTETTFDDTLPAAIETVFSACSDPVSIQGGDSDIDLFDSCDITVMSAGEQVVALGLATESPIALPTTLPSTLGTISGFPVLLPGMPVECPVLVSGQAVFNEIVIEDVGAAWTTHDGLAALELDPVFADEPIVVFTTSAVVPWSCWAFNPPTAFALYLHTRAVLPNGAHELTVDNLDLDFFVHLEDGGDEVISEIVVEVADMDIDSDVSLVEDLVADALAAMGTHESDLDDLAEQILQGSFATAALELIVDDTIYAELDPSHTVCDVEVEAGELVITTDEPGRWSCTAVYEAQYLGR
jgi:hypothetical protein